ncbi:MAG TPA: hypothetical protein VG871_09865 [Vicinamibacterales bacterium]|nr:hypothetical protein [Vicinamibacterales bacterium]
MPLFAGTAPFERADAAFVVVCHERDEFLDVVERPKRDPDLFELSSVLAEHLADARDLAPVSFDDDPQLVNLAAQSAHLAAQFADLAAQFADFAPQSADLAPQFADLAPQLADLAPQLADLAPQLAHFVAQLSNRFFNGVEAPFDASQSLFDVRHDVSSPPRYATGVPAQNSVETSESSS